MLFVKSREKKRGDAIWVISFFSIVTYSVAWNATKFPSMLQEDLGGGLSRVDPNAIVREDGCGVPVDLELLRNVLENGGERRLPRYIYPKRIKIKMIVRLNARIKYVFH